MMDFELTPELHQLRAVVAALAGRYGHEYFVRKAKAGEPLAELREEAANLGLLGLTVPVEYGGGGGGVLDLAIVCEEFAATGCPIELLAFAPAIVSAILTRFGTEAQRRTYLPSIASGQSMITFGMTESEAGSNFNRITTVARPIEDGWVLSGRKVFVSGLDDSATVLVIARSAAEPEGRLRPVLCLVPTDAPGVGWTRIEMELVSPTKHSMLFLDEVLLSSDAVIGAPALEISALFAGLNSERIAVAAHGVGIARYALARATDYARTRQVWHGSIGAHQAIAHPLARIWIGIEQARMLTYRAASLYDQGQTTMAAGYANAAKYAASELAVAAVDTAVQTLGGNGMTTEYGVATLLGHVYGGRIAPISRELILNYIAQYELGLDKSY